MKTKIVISLALGALLFVGCGEKPKEEQQEKKVVEQAIQTPAAEEAKPQTVSQEVVADQPKTFDPAATYATKCSSCHGGKGEGKSIFPKLAGQKKEDIAKKLHGYKDGTFGNDKKAMMIPNANGLSDEEIEKIAEVVSKF